MQDSIIFWDQYFNIETNRGQVGGIERLISNLICELSGKSNIKLIAHANSAICKLLGSLKYNIELINPEKDLNQYVKGSDTLVTFGTYRSFKKISKANPKIILWRVFPQQKSDNLLAKFLLRKTYIKLSKYGSLVFMDNHCRTTTVNYLSLKKDIPILHIPINASSYSHMAKSINNKVRVTYIGRGNELWKIKPVKRLIKDMDKIQNVCFELHIFTDDTQLFKKELSEVSTKNVFIEYHLGYFGNRLREKLKSISDLHFSMGTAALEGGVLGIPTILADGSCQDIGDQYRYRWLKDDIEHYAGVILDYTSKYPDGDKLDEIILQLKQIEQYTLISKETKGLVESNFDLSKVATQLLSLKPEARVFDVLVTMPHYWLTRLKIKGNK